MDKRFKILIGVVVFLAILSGAFLLFAKKKAPTVPVAQKSTPVDSPLKPTNPIQQKNTPVPQPAAPAPVAKIAKPVAPETVAPTSPQPLSQEKAAAILDQWNKCKSNSLAQDAKLFWNVQITEGIPSGGTYAKGNLNNDSAYPVHVTVKSDSQMADKIKSQLVVGKMVIVRATCSGVATDGSVVAQAF